MTDTNSKAQVTEAMVEAGAIALAGDEWKSVNDRPRFREDARTALAAAFAAQEKPEPGVAVKALEWEQIRPCGDMRAKSACGEYNVTFDMHGVWRMFTPGPTEKQVSRFTDLRSAKASAQADYEQRIRSAIAASSPDLPEGDAVQTIAVPEGTRVIVKMGAACDMIIRHPKEDGRCPRSCNHRPDDFSMRDCIEAGECGCIAFPSPIDKGEVK